MSSYAYYATFRLLLHHLDCGIRGGIYTLWYFLLSNEPESNFVTQYTDSNKASNGRILLAEDDHILQIVTSRFLEDAAYLVDVVENGREAIKALETIEYDLVVMDCFMPVMDGFAATRAIRLTGSSVLNTAIPVIALTALNTKTDQKKCVEAGMNDFVSKPVNSDLLIAAIGRCLGAASQQQSATGQGIWDDGFLDSIIDEFLQEVPLVVAELEQARESGDVLALKNISHRLRGPADLIKAATLSTRSEALEKAAMGSDFELSKKYTQALISELQRLCHLLPEE